MYKKIASKTFLFIAILALQSGVSLSADGNSSSQPEIEHHHNIIFHRCEESPLSRVDWENSIPAPELELNIDIEEYSPTQWDSFCHDVRYFFCHPCTIYPKPETFSLQDIQLENVEHKSPVLETFHVKCRRAEPPSFVWKNSIPAPDIDIPYDLLEDVHVTFWERICGHLRTFLCCSTYTPREV